MPNEAKIPVYLEVGGKRTFASAAGWPGWCRSGKNEQAALEALAAYAPRYAAVARLAEVPFPAGEWDFDVVERLEEVAKEKGAKPAQVALAWLMHKKDVASPIIGPTKVGQLE